jgi:ribose transport system ATP-binding protein
MSLIEVQGVDKRFGGQPALDGVDFALRPGEIHALLGENGAGKSTLIKVLAGVVSRDAGEIAVLGQPMPRHYGAAEVARAGLAFVHQDLGLVGSLSVAENIALTNGYARRGPFISHRRTQREAQAILERLQVEIDPRSLVAALSQDERVMVAVARALSADARAIVLDEVSSSLPAPDVARLTESLRRSRDGGLGYVYVTHRLDEVFGFADRITVLRDGVGVLTTRTADTSMDALVGAITGSADTVAAIRPAPSAPDRAPGEGLRVEALAGRGVAEPLSFAVAPGQVLAICGQVGCGAREVADLLGGAARPRSGRAWLGETLLPLGVPARLRELRCDYVPGDRQGAGVIAALSVRENLFATRRRTAAPTDDALVRPRRERRRSRALVERYDVRPGRTEAPMSALSGGNQQKVVMARSLRAQPQLLVVDDPTAGVDVGARVQLHGFVRAAADAGAVVVLVSTDFQEVADLADRALVMAHGRVVADLAAGAISERRLSEASYGVGHVPEEVER